MFFSRCVLILLIFNFFMGGGGEDIRLFLLIGDIIVILFSLVYLFNNIKL